MSEASGRSITPGGVHRGDLHAHAERIRRENRGHRPREHAHASTGRSGEQHVVEADTPA